MSKARKDNKGRALRKGESQRSQDSRYIYTYKSPSGKRCYVYAATLAELRVKEENLIRDQLDGLDTDEGKRADLDYIVNRYLSTKKDLAGITFSGYRYGYEHYCPEWFRKRKVIDFKYSDILNFYLELMDKGLTLGTLGGVHRILNPSFDLAVRDEIIRKNPCTGVMADVKSRKGKDTVPKRALTVEQQHEFMHYVAENPSYRYWLPLFTVLLGTGCRIGEACGLRWEDIDMDERVIDINHSMSYGRRGDHYPYTYEFRMGPPKSEAGYRTIPMLDEVYDTFKELYDEQSKNGFSSLQVDGATGFIFISRTGNLFIHTGVDQAIHRIVKHHNAEETLKAERENREAVIIPQFTCHIFRHTFCTRFCEHETNVKVIQSIMGHSDISTTMNIYADVTEAKKKEVMRDFSKNMKIF